MIFLQRQPYLVTFCYCPLKKGRFDGLPAFRLQLPQFFPVTRVLPSLASNKDTSCIPTPTRLGVSKISKLSMLVEAKLVLFFKEIYNKQFFFVNKSLVIGFVEPQRI